MTNDDIQRAYAALREVSNANVEEVSMKVALWALGELEKANAKADRLAEAGCKLRTMRKQRDNDEANYAAAGQTYSCGDLQLAETEFDTVLAAYDAHRPSLNPPG